MIDVLNINMWKVCVNYNTLFIDRRCYTSMLLAQGSCAVAADSWRENHSNNISPLQMLINMAVVRNANVKNLLQTIAQHKAF